MPLSRRNKAVIATSVAIIIDAVISQKEMDDKLIETGALVIDNIEHKLRICRAPQIPRPKTNGFWTNIFPYLNDEKIQVAIVLQRLANPIGYRQIEQTFGISQGSVTHFTKCFLGAVLDSLQHCIRWPGNRMEEVIEGFAPPELRRRMPNVIGAIDGSHIPIQQPRTAYHQRYINRKGFHSIVLMAIVDDTERFTYIYSGQPGSMHDARVFKQSSFWEELMQDASKYFPANTHLLGDSAFPLLPWLLVPFKEHAQQRLTRAQRQYNKVHSSARMAVERAFGKLKAQWRILKQAMEVIDLRTAVDIVDVCCILHNMCIDCDDLWENETDSNRRINEDNEYADPNGVDTQILLSAQRKRNLIVEQMFLR
ncbi:481_t:CDS:2 [Paraglomus occultum]|uniref:481_t:CDS:1 n=1 Tax=Paraglomus occultum TaxID=144539 RepID=A0A9N9CMH3_9GLOM|nr:481_t:CDS:2 [Paraglomus occultum]